MFYSLVYWETSPLPSAVGWIIKYRFSWSCPALCAKFAAWKERKYSPCHQQHLHPSANHHGNKEIKESPYILVNLSLSRGTVLKMQMLQSRRETNGVRKIGRRVRWKTSWVIPYSSKSVMGDTAVPHLSWVNSSELRSIVAKYPPYPWTQRETQANY